MSNFRRRLIALAVRPMRRRQASPLHQPELQTEPDRPINNWACVLSPDIVADVIHMRWHHDRGEFTTVAALRRGRRPVDRHSPVWLWRFR
jgi:hypothetical protein